MKDENTQVPETLDEQEQLRSEKRGHYCYCHNRAFSSSEKYLLRAFVGSRPQRKKAQWSESDITSFYE